MKKIFATAAATALCAYSAAVLAQALPSFAPVIKAASPAVVNIAVRGTVAQVAYFGDYSHVAIEAAPEVRITCYQAHRSRRDPGAIAEGEVYWVSWDPADCILLPG